MTPEGVRGRAVKARAAARPGPARRGMDRRGRSEAPEPRRGDGTVFLFIRAGRERGGVEAPLREGFWWGLAGWLVGRVGEFFL